MVSQRSLIIVKKLKIVSLKPTENCDMIYGLKCV